MKITENLFSLTPEQIEASKTIYDGKVIKCLVAPYHSYSQLEKIIPYTKNTYLFPERELSSSQLSSIVAMIAKNTSTEEFRIITASQNIILDMIDSSVRVLTESGDIVDCPCKTFMANIHTIRYELLENEAHQISKVDKAKSREKVQGLIDRVQGGTISRSEYNQLIKEIEMVGEPIISGKLKEMAVDNLNIIN